MVWQSYLKIDPGYRIQSLGTVLRGGREVQCQHRRDLLQCHLLRQLRPPYLDILVMCHIALLRLSQCIMHLLARGRLYRSRITMAQLTHKCCRFHVKPRLHLTRRNHITHEHLRLCRTKGHSNTLELLRQVGTKMSWALLLHLRHLHIALPINRVELHHLSWMSLCIPDTRGSVHRHQYHPRLLAVI